MARLLGTTTSDRWEREIRRRLGAELPSDWIVVSNVSWATRSEAGYVRDGQCDFVVLAPSLGMVVVEVKGSRSVRVDPDGTWYRTEWLRGQKSLGREVRIDEPPPEQACRNMHEISRIASKGLRMERFPGCHAFVVCYPNGTVRGAVDLYDQTTIIDSRQLPEIHPRLRAALQARGPKSVQARFTLDIAKQVGCVLSSSRFSVEPSDVPLDAKEDIGDVEELTRQQFVALRGMFDLPRVAIVGPAGSGKTLLALWRLAALLEVGERAIYVCFNVALAGYLRSKHPDLATAIVSVDKLFMQACGNKRTNAGTQYFTQDLPDEVFSRAVELPQEDKYDSIIVDEGQDFGEYRLMALHELLKENGRWLIFADQSQALYGKDNEVLIGAEVIFRLHHNCRNPRRINGASNKFCGKNVESMPGIPAGTSPRIENSSSRRGMAQEAWNIAREFKDVLSIAFLSPYKFENSCLAECPKGFGMELTCDINEFGARGKIFFSTIKSFKGIEAECVIVVDIDVPESTPAFGIEDLYVACTRATGRLVLLTASRAAYDWLLDRNPGAGTSIS